MDWLEEELKRALAREEPPCRELRLKPTQARMPVPLRLKRQLAVAACLAVVGVGSAAGWREYRGVTAKKQVMLAVRIAGSRLSRIQAQVRETRP
jgi:hypothetical protein